MLFAETHGKLGRDGSLAHDRAEDLLTSTAFQLLGYLPPLDGLLAVLRRTRAVRWEGATAVVDREPPEWLTAALRTASGYSEPTFWERWPGFGEPDVWLTLTRGSQEVASLVIEVKFDSPKSTRPDGPGGSEADTPPSQPRDQLWDYCEGLRRRRGELAAGVIYLTSHATPPTDELSESLRLAKNADPWLGWLSWRDVWAEIRDAGKHSRPAADLAQILAAKGLSHFAGFNRTPWRQTAPLTRFWPAPEHRAWFVGAVLRMNVTQPRFWTPREPV
ncbi:hypothetical protein [Gemmata sp.]|uniref:hypothetical protein n=1 Tax=Gemmata sp. TaxID=1914242 RepID=UPI003F729864